MAKFNLLNNIINQIWFISPNILIYKIQPISFFSIVNRFLFLLFYFGIYLIIFLYLLFYLYFEEIGNYKFIFNLMVNVLFFFIFIVGFNKFIINYYYDCSKTLYSLIYNENKKIFFYFHCKLMNKLYTLY